MNHEPRKWSLQEAKAKFSEVVRLAQSEGPQVVTVHGKDAVVISKPEKSAIDNEVKTGTDLWNAMRGKGPYFDLKIPPRPKGGKFRDVTFEK